MRIVFAERMGFCRGVRRAFDATMALARELGDSAGETYMLGDLVHNRQVVERVSAAGILQTEHAEGLSGARVIIRTHGEAKEAIDLLVTANNQIIDLTCGVVKSVREKAVELQQRHPAIIVVGKKDHPEVQGLVSYLQNPHVVTNPIEVAGLPDYASVGVVEQTTIERNRFEKVHAALVEKYGADGVEALDTICPHTDENQSASREVAKRCDIILVVGDAHSSNSRRLLEVCREENPRSHFISCAGEIDPSWFPPEGDEQWETLNVGITAGASTPDWTIDGIAAKVRELAGVKEKKGRS